MITKILPFNYRERIHGLEKEKHYEFTHGRNKLYFYNAKKAIHYLCIKLNLQRTDEVAIFTSTNSNYVSTCVSATFFNYCKLSRVITPNTKLIYIIHEFGLPHPLTEDLVSYSKKNGIISVEDCAHVIDSRTEAFSVGQLGDYIIYSLAKHLPIKNGGLLVSNNVLEQGFGYNETEAINVENEVSVFIPYLPNLNNLRRVHFDTLTEGLPLKFLKFHNLKNLLTPYLAIICTNKKNLINTDLEDLIEVHPTHVENQIAITTQPLEKNATYIELNKILKKHLL